MQTDIRIYQQFIWKNQTLIHFTDINVRGERYLVYGNKEYYYVRINDKLYSFIKNNFNDKETNLVLVSNYIQDRSKNILVIRPTYSGGNNDSIFKDLPDIFKLYWYQHKIYEPVITKDFSIITADNIDGSNIILKSKSPLSALNLTKDNGLYLKQRKFNSIVDKLLKNETITSKEMLYYNSIEDKVQSINTKHTDDKEKLLLYIKDTKEKLKKQNIGFKEENIIDTTKTILNFIKVADIFKLILVGLTVISIIIYIMVLLISIYNLINLLIKIISNIIYLFYNTGVTHNDTLSYMGKNIIKCTKDNYTGDIFNVLNEQLTALSVFNTNIYIIYILLGYVILYLLYFIYSSIFTKFYILNGTIKDIDPNFTLLTLIAIIFGSTFIHLLIYKFLFKTVCFNGYKDANTSETNLDDTIKNYLSRFKNTNDATENEIFYKLLTDTTKKDEIDIKFQNMVVELQEEESITNLGKFLLIYDLYIYFQDYLYITDDKNKIIQDYFNKMMQNEDPSITFISLLDLNERRLIKPSHEELPFYNQIPTDKIEYFKKINTDVGEIINKVNKSIIKYEGSFYPFLFTCIYIFIICIYNFITTYIILKYISDNKDEKIFPQFIYNIADKFIEISIRIYKLFNN